jgi:hypothetical protein
MSCRSNLDVVKIKTLQLLCHRVPVVQKVSTRPVGLNINIDIESSGNSVIN